MKTHYSEADLLETYYMQPGESMPVMMHLASCEVCAARYDALERKLREAASCNTEKHETFWTRQRMSIQRRIADGRERAASRMQMTRIAAAAVLAFFLGGIFTYRTIDTPHSTTPTTTAHAVAPQPPAATDDELQVPHDPWQNEELSDFHSVVEWESWVPENEGKKL
jgi:predicted anti-sigma-YlaC factor YlaD